MFYEKAVTLQPELQYDDPPVTIRSLTVNFDKSISSGLAEYYAGNEPDEVFYHHPDHLGSASWITNVDGYPVQYLMYAPYGEQILNQQPIWYDERFTFTGKERDAETGYFHIEARKYFDLLGIWISSDPLLDKFIYNSSYVYCEGNPIKFVDLDGREKHIYLSMNESFAARNFRDDNGIYIFGHGSLGLNRYIADDRGCIRRPLYVADLVNHVRSSDQYKNDVAEGNTSMVFLYVCHAGEGENNIAQQLSIALNDHETFVIGPIGILESSNDPRYPQNGSYDGVKNSNTKKEGAWGVYKNGQLQTTIRGNRTPTKATVKCKMFFDNLLKSIKNFFKNENE